MIDPNCLPVRWPDTWFREPNLSARLTNWVYTNTQLLALMQNDYNVSISVEVAVGPQCPWFCRLRPVLYAKQAQGSGIHVAPVLTDTSIELTCQRGLSWTRCRNWPFFIFHPSDQANKLKLVSRTLVRHTDQVYLYAPSAWEWWLGR